MVSTFHLALIAGFAIDLASAGQQSFRAPSTPTNNASTGTQPSGILITPEMRGDIFMARKMFREAIEVYKEGPADSAVLMNKTGIGYHQMLDLVTA